MPEKKRQFLYLNFTLQLILKLNRAQYKVTLKKKVKGQTKQRQIINGATVTGKLIFILLQHFPSNQTQPEWNHDIIQENF